MDWFPRNRLRRNIYTIVFAAYAIVVMMFFHAVNMKRDVRYHELRPMMTGKVNDTRKLRMRRVKSWTPLDSEPKDTLLIYIHIPRTAGSAFKKIVNNLHGPYRGLWYPTKPSHIYPGCQLHHADGGKYCSYSELNTCVQGRRIQSEIENIHTKSQVRYATVIRDPVDRVLSEYVAWRATEEQNPGWDNNLGDRAYYHNNLTEWVLAVNNTAHNRQVKSLADLGNTDFLRSFGSQCANQNAAKDIGYWQNYTLMNEDEGLLDNVIANIEENFAFIGLAEDLKHSGEQAKLILRDDVEYDAGWAEPKRPSTSVPEVGDDVRRLILSRNSLDARLYQFIKKKMTSTRYVYLVKKKDKGGKR